MQKIAKKNRARPHGGSAGRSRRILGTMTKRKRVRLSWVPCTYCGGKVGLTTMRGRDYCHGRECREKHDRERRAMAKRRQRAARAVSMPDRCTRCQEPKGEDDRARGYAHCLRCRETVAASMRWLRALAPEERLRHDRRTRAGDRVGRSNLPPARSWFDPRRGLDAIARPFTSR
jgi:hypothetical protein